MNEHFNDHISIFENFHSKPVSIPLIKWLNACKKGSKHSVTILQYRQSLDSSIKKSLPLATVGAVLKGGRKAEHVRTCTGWIALDIDAKDNPHIENASRLRDEIANIVYVAFSGLSVSGNGVWALVKVSTPKRQNEHFEQLKIDFQSLGITLDSTKGKNANDGRFYSYDPDSIIKNSFKIYDRIPLKQSNSKKPSNTIRYTSSANDVEAVLNEIQKQRLNIAPDYITYRNVGFALADEYGERGRTYFHGAVCYSEKYNEFEADKQFNQCLKANGSGITISTFFYLCKQFGIYSNNKNNRNIKASHFSTDYGFNPYTGEIFDKRGYPASWDSINLN